MNWYNSLTTPEKIYFYIAVIGTVLLVIQIIMMICSFGGGADADADGDFGANVTLTGGVCLQTEESWKAFIRSEAVSYGGQDAELYFEEDDFDAFAERLKATDRVKYVHPVFEHRWGQRVVRFFDPDGHIVEVGENMNAVCARFAAAGMTEEEIAARMDVPVSYVRAHRKKSESL